MKILLLCLSLLVLAAEMRAQSSNGLKIGPGDLLNVEVFDVPELKQEVRVSDTGDADFLLLGKMHVADLTVEEAQKSIATQLSTRQLVVAPQVSLLVREYATQGVAVTGEVRKPGVYQVLGPRTLSQLLAEAGGVTDVASLAITIQHRDGSEFTVSRNAETPTDSPMMRPGDTVIVPRAGVAYLVGDVARSGGYVMQDGGQLSLAQLIALGGGLLPTAKTTKAHLVRKTATGREEFEINVREILSGKSPDIALQPDDILFVPNSAWKSTANRLLSIAQMTAGAAIYTSLN